MKTLSLIFLLAAGLLLAGSESEYFLGNIIGIVMLFIAGEKMNKIRSPHSTKIDESPHV